MTKDEALKFLQDERLAEIKEFTTELDILLKKYDITLDMEVLVNPSGTSKRIIVLDNKKLV
jgi:hypothetical protein